MYIPFSKPKKKILNVFIKINWREVGIALLAMIMAIGLAALCEFAGINLFAE